MNPASCGNAHLGEEGILFVDHHIDRYPDQHFRQYVEKFVEDGVDRRLDHVRAVLAGVGEQAL
ncbi:hypothetical protein [Thiothrix lacustris]|uniref:hypothetical protein n=1 Tax=Thiothrix lacustris TaxID=525917 RepID=UPI001B80D06C|nr:hypothetical protein [Thiothrix lacustris]